MRLPVMRRIIFIVTLMVVLVGCSRQPQHYTYEVLNRMTPVKNQGKSQTCWIYAMLAAIETEHLRWGDSVNLSPAFIEQKLSEEPASPESHRGMGATLLSLIQKHGIVGFDAMRTTKTPAPRWVFMYGAQYTTQEFARSVCRPDEYLLLTSNSRQPYFQEIDIDAADNWLHARFMNLPMDSLLSLTEQAVRHHRGVCWESAAHAMAIVGIAHDEYGRKYFVMKNSWGTNRPNNGLDFLSFDAFRRKTLAVELPRNSSSNHPDI